MRADRLLSILLLLQVHQRLTSRELAERLEVSERTVHRDMEALCAAGVPLAAQRGAGGGWGLPDGYRTNLTGLNPSEVQALFLAQPVGPLRDLGLDAAARAGTLKLLAALPSPQRKNAEYIRQRIHIDTTAWHPSQEQAQALPTLQDALWQERRVHLTYQRSDGEPVERLVDPLGLVAKGSAWYLVAAVEGETRTYRISRVQAARLADQASARPQGFDLAAYWEQSAAQFVASLPSHEAVLRASPAAQPQLRHGGRFTRVEEVGPPGEDGWRRVRLRYETQEEGCEFALGFGPEVEVLEPLELRLRVIEQAQATARFYASRAVEAP